MKRQRENRDICKRVEPVPEIPIELQMEILMRLPVKSLMRFKSVSTLWSSLICSEYFVDRFLKVSSSPLRIYMDMWSSDGNKKVMLSASSSPGSDLSTFVIDQDFSITGMEGYSVSHIYRGLICFTKRPSVQIYNTSTRQLVVLPDIEVIAEDHHMMSLIHWTQSMYRIVHDPILNQYKVVCIDSVIPRFGGMIEIWVLLLGGDYSSGWRKISSPFQPHYFLTPTRALTINGRIYYLAWVRLHDDVLVFVSFDIRSEEINIHQKPEYLPFCPYSTKLIEYGGRLALLNHTDLEYKGVMELWVMEDEEKSIWSKKTLVLQPSQMHIIQGIHLKVNGTTRNGEVIFVHQSDRITVYPHESNVFLYNLQNNHLRNVEIKQTSKRHLHKILELVGFNDVRNLMHL